MLSRHNKNTAAGSVTVWFVRFREPARRCLSQCAPAHELVGKCSRVGKGDNRCPWAGGHGLMDFGKRLDAIPLRRAAGRAGRKMGEAAQTGPWPRLCRPSLSHGKTANGFVHMEECGRPSPSACPLVDRPAFAVCTTLWYSALYPILQRLQMRQNVAARKCRGGQTRRVTWLLDTCRYCNQLIRNTVFSIIFGRNSINGPLFPQRAFRPAQDRHEPRIQP